MDYFWFTCVKMHCSCYLLPMVQTCGSAQSLLPSRLCAQFVLRGYTWSSYSLGAAYVWAIWFGVTIYSLMFRLPCLEMGQLGLFVLVLVLP